MTAAKSVTSSISYGGPLLAGVLTVATVANGAQYEDGTYVPSVQELPAELRQDRRAKLSTLSEGNGNYSDTQTVGLDDDPSIGAMIPIEFSECDLAQALVRGFSSLRDGLDGPDSVAPSGTIIDDALIVLQNWPSGIPAPEPDVDVDGHIVLELYDDEGFTLGGIELIGGHNAIYSIVKKTSVLAKGRFNTTSPSEILRKLNDFKRELA